VEANLHLVLTEHHGKNPVLSGVGHVVHYLMSSQFEAMPVEVWMPAEGVVPVEAHVPVVAVVEAWVWHVAGLEVLCRHPHHLLYPRYSKQACKPVVVLVASGVRGTTMLKSVPCCQ